MPRRLELHEDRLFPADPAVRAIARALYGSVRDLPIISPHGHTDPAWFATNEPFTNATDLFIAPDHYLYRMLYSQGHAMKDLRVEAQGARAEADPRAAWKLFARNFHLFNGTPSWLWLNWVFQEVFRFEHQLGEETADAYFDGIGAALQRPEFRPRALFERFRIEVIATTEGPNDSLNHHRAIRESGWKGRVITTYRPDAVVDPEHPDFATALPEFGELTKQDVHSWRGYLEAHRIRRAVFQRAGATATDHGHPTPRTADLSPGECEALLARVVAGKASAADAEQFRAQMLVEMARMSIDDGLVMQIHPGAFRNHNARLFAEFGRDKGADIPLSVDYVHGLKPLLDRFGNDKRLSVIVFTLDESTYSRELAPLAGHYPVLKLGPAWWFHDSPEGMMRFREQTTETAGFYNTVGFNDDTRAFLSIPARHDVARRIDCSFLARLVAEHRLEKDDAQRIAIDLAYRLPKQAYKL
jgi:glucuronate isomerase